MHRALYRKWRPTTFDEVVGQAHITDVLRYEVQNGRVSHAYLFCGSRGTGKTTCAKILAKAANCLSPVNGNPCGVCESCRLIESGLATDILEMDAASNTGVDYIREIRDEVVYAPSALHSRVYIIDEVHMLTESAFNALLKTLEEPPQNVIFILATTEMQKIPATILSRCQSFDFRRIPSDLIAERLRYIAMEEGGEAEEEACYLIARLAGGGMRDAISLLELCMAEGEKVTTARVEQVSGSAGRELTSQTVRAILQKDAAALFEIVAKLYHSSKDIAVFWQELLAFYRDMIVVKTAGKTDPALLRREILDVTEGEMQALTELSAQMRYETLLYHVRILDDAYTKQIRGGDSKRLAAEMTLLRLTTDSLDASPAALLQRIGALEDVLLSGGIKVAEPKREEAGYPAVGQSESEKKTVPPAPSAPIAPAAAVEVPASTEITAWAEVVAAFEKKSRSAAAFLNEEGGWLDQNGVAHIRLRGSFAKSVLSQQNNLSMLQSILSRILKREITGIQFEIEALNVPAETANPTDGAFD